MGSYAALRMSYLEREIAALKALAEARERWIEALEDEVARLNAKVINQDSRLEERLP